MKSITEAIKSHGALSDNERLYRVTGQGRASLFVVSNSPARAALSVVTVEAVSAKEINQALMAEVLSKDSEKEHNNEES